MAFELYFPRTLHNEAAIAPKFRRRTKMSQRVHCDGVIWEG